MEVERRFPPFAQPGLATTSGRPLRGLAFTFPDEQAAIGSDIAHRALDILIGLIALVFVLPLMVAIGVAIILDSRGPVLVRQYRIGRGMRPFRMLKFRSMVEGAEMLLQELAPVNEADGPLFKMRRDPRVTRVGRVLRRSSLDELPQLFNVIAGDMSLVGPRPPFPHEVESDVHRQHLRLSCRPGMTGLAQIGGRSEISYDDMVRLDLRYARSRSLLLDLAILIKTVPAVLTRRGAY